MATMTRQQRRRLARKEQKDPAIVAHVVNDKTPVSSEGLADDVVNLLAEGISAERLSFLLQSATNYSAETLALTRQANGLPDKTECKVGCAWCCYQLTEVMPAEALVIADHLRATRSHEELEAVKQRIVDTDNVTRGMDHDQRFEAIMPCPFLENNMCSVYEVRPITCRAWNSEDVSKCKAALENPDKLISTRSDAIQLRCYAIVKDALMKGTDRVGMESDPVELTAALRIALEAPDALKRWAAGERVFAEAKAPKLSLTRVFPKMVKAAIGM